MSRWDEAGSDPSAGFDDVTPGRAPDAYSIDWLLRTPHYTTVHSAKEQNSGRW